MAPSTGTIHRHHPPAPSTGTIHRHHPAAPSKTSMIQRLERIWCHVAASLPPAPGQQNQRFERPTADDGTIGQAAGAMFFDVQTTT
jgi:hypothetical protein